MEERSTDQTTDLSLQSHRPIGFAGRSPQFDVRGEKCDVAPGPDCRKDNAIENPRKENQSKPKRNIRKTQRSPKRKPKENTKGDPRRGLLRVCWVCFVKFVCRVTMNGTGGPKDCGQIWQHAVHEFIRQNSGRNHMRPYLA